MLRTNSNRGKFCNATVNPKRLNSDSDSESESESSTDNSSSSDLDYNSKSIFNFDMNKEFNKNFKKIKNLSNKYEKQVKKQIKPSLKKNNLISKSDSGSDTESDSDSNRNQNLSNLISHPKFNLIDPMVYLNKARQFYQNPPSTYYSTLEKISKSNQIDKSDSDSDPDSDPGPNLKSDPNLDPDPDLDPDPNIPNQFYSARYPNLSAQSFANPNPLYLPKTIIPNVRSALNQSFNHFYRDPYNRFYDVVPSNRRDKLSKLESDKCPYDKKRRKH